MSKKAEPNDEENKYRAMKENIKKTVLPNGLRVITERIPQFHSATIGIWVNVGSVDEDDSNRGISHFLEHLMFKGTPTRTARQIAETMDEIGGNLNAFTEKEQTCFYAKVMDKHISLAMEMLGDMIQNSSFPEEEMEKEKGVILEEIRMYEDSPDEQVFDLIAQAAWENHPLGQPILGTSQSVLSLSRDMLLNFVKRFYSPDKIIISLAGRVKHESIVELCEKHFLFPGSKNGVKPEISPPLFNKTQIIRYKETEQVHFCLGMKGISQRDELRYPLSILDTVLGGSVSSRLFQEVREKRGLAYAISSFQGSYADSALFGIYGATNPSNFSTVIQLLLEILEEVRKKGITKREFQKAKEHLKGSLSLTLESASNRMIRLAKSESYYQRFISYEEILQKIKAITLEDVQALAREILQLNSATWAVLGPISGEIHLG